MSKKLQCQDCGQAEYGEDLYNYDGELLCRYCIVARVYEGSIPCEYVGTCNDKTYPNKTEQITQLKQQLAEKEKQIDIISRDNNSYKYNIDEQKRIIDDFTKQLQEKDKEIERLKNLFKLNNEVVINQGQEIFNLRVQVLQQKQNQTQLAIQELEKVGHLLVEKMETPTDKLNCFYYIDQQIKLLKGEKDVED